jgi:hypothetical protein
MKRLVVALFLVCVAVPASATSITWGPASASDDNGGAFLAGASVLVAGETWRFLLPGYSTTSQFGFPPNEVDLGVSATATGGQIVGLTYSFFGDFLGSGSAAYDLTASAAHRTGMFSTSLLNVFQPLAPTNAVNLSTQLSLLDAGDFASIREVRFQLATVPEPATLALVGLGAAILFRRRFRT